MWQRNHTVKDVMVLPVRLRNFRQEIGGIKFISVDHHPAPFCNHSTWLLETNSEND